MAVPFNDNLGIRAPKVTDSRQMKTVSGASAPWDSVAEAHAGIVYKTLGLPIYITISGSTVPHWYEGGLEEVNLVPIPTSTGMTLELANTYADISTSLSPRWIRVATDENNNGDKSLYLHNGTTLEFIQTIV